MRHAVCCCVCVIPPAIFFWGRVKESGLKSIPRLNLVFQFHQTSGFQFLRSCGNIFIKNSGASHISKPKSATKDQGLLGNISLYQTFIWGLNPATVNETTPHPNVTQWLLLWMFLFYISRHWRWKWQRNLRDNCWLTRLNVVVASDGFLMASRCLGDDHFMMGVMSSLEGRRIDSLGGNPTQ